jgi:hypothetical protein
MLQGEGMLLMKKPVILYGIFMLILITALPAPACQPEPEQPVVASWLSEGLVEEADFSAQRISAPGGSLKMLVLEAVVPSGTLADEGGAENLQSRLASDIPVPEDIDMVVVKLCEQQGVGWKSKVKGFPIVGKKRMDDQTWQLFLDTIGGCE